MQRSPRYALHGFVVSLAIALTLTSGTSAQEIPTQPGSPDYARQFDFWIGEWDVNLRVRQPDLTWTDQHRAVDKIYPILSGKALLELWSEDKAAGIKGYSLRYFDTERDEWVLWLNWPGENRSGSSSLSGGFRHGRGDFYSTAVGTDGTETISRYSFNDITSTSLRWEDAFSTDGGESWTHSWIMEFSRTADKPSLGSLGGPAHTFHEGDRCDAPEFRRYEFLSGVKSGEVVAGGSGGVTITGHQVLDGCAVMTFAGADGDSERAWGFSHLTFNTVAQRYELTTLTAQPNTPVRMFFSRTPDDLILYESSEGNGPVDRFRIEEDEDGVVLWIHETPSGDEWHPVWGGLVRPAN